jgi:iron complex transport system permease protein
MKQMLSGYKSFYFKKKLALLFALLGALLAGFLSLCTGSITFSPADVIAAFTGADSQAAQVLLGIRLPRALAGLLTGAILASSGAVMQCVLQNPLASASTLGVSQGAAFGAAIGILFFSGGVVNSASAATAVTIYNPLLVTLCAFVFGSLSSVVILLIFRKKRGIGSAGLILAGTALSSLFSGGSTLLQYFADETKLGAIVFWTFGNLGSAGPQELLVLAVILLFSLFFFLYHRWNYNAMESGGDTAESLGVNTRFVMLSSMAVCSLAAAAAVSFVGIIGFVGLIAPHIMVRFTGRDYRYLIPASAAAGGLLLTLADTFARTVIAPVVLPIGAITSFLGAPVFLFLLFQGGKKRGTDF